MHRSFTLAIPIASEKSPMKKVLVPYDGSESATRALQFVLDQTTAVRPEVVHLLNVQDSPAFYGEYLTGQDIQLYRQWQLDQGTRELEPAARKLADAKLAFNTHVVLGTTAQAITNQAKTLSCDQIVMGTRGLGAIKGLVLGSIATQVIHLAEVPVTLVK